MTVFTATLSQTAFLFLFILAGYILAKWNFVPDNAQTVLSKLENTLFVPALVLGTFMDNFTVHKITVAWELISRSFLLALIAIALALLSAGLCTRDRYEKRIYTYGLSFSNFGFMGNAVVNTLYPNIFLDYLIFTLPLWSLIYLWGVPVLLMGTDTAKPTLCQRLRNFLNPMFAATILGMVIGITGLTIPQFVSSAVATAGSCMSPIAMLLTGMTIARFDLGEVLKIKSVYLVSALRLILFPLLFIGIMRLIPLPEVFATCAVCSLSMPLGLNTIIIPAALGKDTKVASGMALVSHLLSCVTIPIIFAIFQSILSTRI